MGERGLPKGKELEEAMLCVNGREFIVRLDWARRGVEEGSNAWTLLTGIAYKNPQKFISFVDEFSNQLFEWYEVDHVLHSGPHKKIPAIKKYREITGVGLKEAKAAVEDRMRILGL